MAVMFITHDFGVVGEIADRVAVLEKGIRDCTVDGATATWAQVPGAGASDVMALLVGYDKLARETGWRPLVSWEEGISKTIGWYPASTSAGTNARSCAHWASVSP